MSWKYIMMEVEHEGTKVHLPVLFPSNFVHADVYEALRMANRRSTGRLRLPWVDPRIYSAGQIDGLKIHIAHGGSETLNVKSAREDTYTINHFQYLKGIQ